MISKDFNCRILCCVSVKCITNTKELVIPVIGTAILIMEMLARAIVDIFKGRLKPTKFALKTSEMGSYRCESKSVSVKTNILGL